MKKFILIIFVSFVTVTTSQAQGFSGDDKFLIAWEVAFPTNDFVSETSFAGGKIGYQHRINDNVFVGLSGSWNSFSQYVSKTTYQKPDGSGAITTDIVKEVYSVPLTLDVQYFLSEGKPLTPYVGLGLGTMYSDQTIYFNIYNIYDKNWGFVARPEIGALYSFNRSSALSLSATYNYATNKSELVDINNLSHFSLAIGFVFSE